MYKPGQLVTIDNKVYRIKREECSTNTCPACGNCAFIHENCDEYPCNRLCLFPVRAFDGGIYYEFLPDKYRKIPNGCYLESILCGNQVK